MPHDLAQHIHDTPLVDTHEHLRKEKEWTEDGPDILQDLFGNYVTADLHTAGASAQHIELLMDASNPDIAARFNAIRPAWEASQFTGYGEAVRLLASNLYGIEELTAETIQRAAPRTASLRQPGERYRILHDLAKLDHVQTDDFCWPCLPDASGPDFFLYDISWAGFCSGEVNPEAIQAETGIDVKDLPTLQEAMEAIFDKHANCAIAVKAQHAYNRTLLWRERSDSEAASALQDILSQPADKVPTATRLCLGDWAWARGVELSMQHNLPFKIHTGYYAGNNRMPVDRIRPGHMCELLAKYLDARFVLMHISYPYSHELVALAKHYRNVWIDFCGAWSIDPYASRDCLRKCLHAVPANKIFAFGGDTSWPTSAYAYSLQARREITHALQAEIDEGYLSEPQAISLATRLMGQNQYDCFDLPATRAHIQSARANPTSP